MRSDRLVLDTHVWKAYVEGAGLSAKIVKRIDGARANGGLGVAAISVWEIAMLAAKGSLKLNGSTLAWVSGAIRGSGAVVHPLEPAIAVDSAELPLFHGDSADRMIVATTRHVPAALVTRDAKILDWAKATKGVRVLEP
jgi:PIN domain nuclease of toxin-antitoxin system